MHNLASNSDMRIDLRFFSFVAAASALLSGCTGGKQIPAYGPEVAGSPQHGRAIIEEYRCGECHQIPGISGAHGVFGPPLDEMSRRTYIAGEFPNNAQNMVRWVQSPKSMKPGTAMPDLGLTDAQAEDVTAYLEKLR